MKTFTLLFGFLFLASTFVLAKLSIKLPPSQIVDFLQSCLESATTPEEKIEIEAHLAAAQAAAATESAPPKPDA